MKGAEHRIIGRKKNMWDYKMHRTGIFAENGLWKKPKVQSTLNICRY